MDKIVFVCDRGPNLLKALEDYQVVHCFPYRLNNILKRTFYSAGVKEKIQRKESKQLSNKEKAVDQSTLNDFTIDDGDACILDYDDRDSEESEDDDDDGVVLDANLVELALRSLSTPPERDHINVPQDNLPLYATHLLATIVRCKDLCCYVKRVGYFHLSSICFIQSLTCALCR